MRAGVRPAASDRGPRAGRRRPVRDAIGRYSLETLLHRGAHFEVWRAAEIAAHSVVALKLLRSTRASRALKREYQIASELAHPNICRARDWIETADCKAIAFEYLSGGDLVSLAGLECRHWLGAARDLTAALQYLHQRGLVHRDIKARNVMFDADDRAQLIDFGSAVLSGSPWRREGTTAEHLKPGWVGQVHSAGDDVYALAGLLHELLYGAPPGSPSGGQAPGSVAPAAETLAALVAATLAAEPRDCTESLADYAVVIESAIAQVSNS